LISIYLTYYFKQQIAIVKSQQSFLEEDFKKLFEFSMTKQGREEESEDKENQHYVFKKKTSYHFTDLIEFYEKTRFTIPFLVYRSMNLWPYIDYFAQYGHVMTNFAIVYIAINLSNSFFNCFNILCVCLFYLISAQVVHNRAHTNYDRAGL
jgi:hypothetical protein